MLGVVACLPPPPSSHHAHPKLPNAARLLGIPLGRPLQRVLEPALLAVYHGKPRLVNQPVAHIELASLVLGHLVPKQLVVRRLDRLARPLALVVVDEEVIRPEDGGREDQPAR